MIEKIYILPFTTGGIIGVIFAGTVLLNAFLFDYLESQEVPQTLNTGRHKGYSMDIWVMPVDEEKLIYRNRELIGEEAHHVLY